MNERCVIALQFSEPMNLIEAALECEQSGGIVQTVTSDDAVRVTSFLEPFEQESVWIGGCSLFEVSMSSISSVSCNTENAYSSILCSIPGKTNWYKN